MPFLKLDGYRLYYETHGQGFPLVLIRGLGSNMEHWYEQIPAFSRQYRVITFNNRGIGTSSAPPLPWSIKEMAGDVAALIQAVAGGRAHVLGISMGGMIAQELALGWPERVASLVLTATHCGGAHKVMPTTETLELFDKLVNGTTFAEQMEGRKALFSQETLDNRPDVLERYAQVAAAYACPPEVMHGQWQAIQEFGTFERLPGIKAPTLVLAGADDRLVPQGNAELLAERIPGAKLALIPQAGHQLVIEAPQATNAAVLEFLASQPV
ncbi:MAG: alpha/beta hydrolase [Desulfarculus sp.]|nr:alpha/beta hydrolase [Pseudomonadota bacterium]MBV1715013.1 alpha/beta hydrolase [Desulfarculus sp.]MBU4573474.1 alpha/beta hydrolase [Pseudomonadota bacterium]MBU4599714.1 alpha/beta hydrolase [Pseudomonadota bacterium]MBV1739943.1 alpha/beta hydrolase [Desulfarculus sp.]